MTIVFKHLPNGAKGTHAKGQLIIVRLGRKICSGAVHIHAKPGPSQVMIANLQKDMVLVFIQMMLSVTN